MVHRAYEFFILFAIQCICLRGCYQTTSTLLNYSNIWGIFLSEILLKLLNPITWFCFLFFTTILTTDTWLSWSPATFHCLFVTNLRHLQMGYRIIGLGRTLGVFLSNFLPRAEIYDVPCWYLFWVLYWWKVHCELPSLLPHYSLSYSISVLITVSRNKWPAFFNSTLFQHNY